MQEHSKMRHYAGVTVCYLHIGNLPIIQDAVAVGACSVQIKRDTVVGATCE